MYSDGVFASTNEQWFDKVYVSIKFDTVARYFRVFDIELLCIHGD